LSIAFRAELRVARAQITGKRCAGRFDLKAHFAGERDRRQQPIWPKHLFLEHEVGRDKQRGWNAQALQHRRCIGEHVAKTVVEGDADGALRRGVLS
jgi:hypothetical protein